MERSVLVFNCMYTDTRNNSVHKVRANIRQTRNELLGENTNEKVGHKYWEPIAINIRNNRNNENTRKLCLKELYRYFRRQGYLKGIILQSFRKDIKYEPVMRKSRNTERHNIWSVMLFVTTSNPRNSNTFQSLEPLLRRSKKKNPREKKNNQQ